MAKRFSCPNDHMAVIISKQLADEIMSLCKLVRISPRDVAHESNRAACQKIAGDLILAIVEAKHG